MTRSEDSGGNRRGWLGVLLALAILSAGPRAWAEEMTPEDQLIRLREGVGLHDRGDYDGALSKYHEVLAANPKNATALFEMSFTLAAQREWQACYEVAEKAVHLDTPLRAQLYMNAGICRDAAGDPKKAIALFKSGLRESAEDSGLWFNLAVVYLKVGDNSKAQTALERTLHAEPTRLTANFALGELYAKTGERIPALLAQLRYLSLDYESARAGTAAQWVETLLWNGVTSESADKVTISLPKDTGKGPYAGPDMALYLLASSRYLPENKDKNKLQQVSEMLDALFSSMGESASEWKKPCFPCEQFGPYFEGMKAKSLVEPFVYVALASLDPQASTAWQEANPTKIADLKAWLGSQKQGSTQLPQ